MRNKLAVLLAFFTASACSPNLAEQQRASLPSPVATSDHPLAGFWKDGHCDDEFGLSIAPAGEGLYSVSFCGPGGCFEPGTYRPNTPIVGDPDYQVIDSNTLGIGTRNGGFQRYSRCPVEPNSSIKPKPSA
jgi:hypothetical protein